MVFPFDSSVVISSFEVVMVAQLLFPSPCEFIPGKHQARKLHRATQALAGLLALGCQRPSAGPQVTFLGNVPPVP